LSQRELLETLSSQGVELWVEGGRLRFRAPKGALTPALRASMTENKDDLVMLLREQASQSITELPMAYGQQSLWFLHQVAPDNAAYNVSFSTRIRSGVNIEALQASFQALLDRHAILRTTYTARDGQPIQQIYGYLPVNFEQIDSAGWSEETLYERVRRDYLRPFDLQNGPILRVSLYTRAPEDHVLLITVHHIAVDGWSLWLLLDDLRLLYTAQVEGTAASLPRPEAEYADYLRWQTELLQGAEGERLWNYWQKQLSGELPVLNLPADFPRPHTQAYRGASHNFLIDEKLTAQLKTVAKAEGVTLYTILLAAFEILLYRYSGQDEILVGSPTFGRSRPEFAKVVGDFVNMTTLRADFSSNPKFKDFLSQVRQSVLGALDHQDYPFARLIEQLGGQRDPSRSPLFQATFDLQRIQAFGELGVLFMPGENHSRVEFGKLMLEPYTMPQQEGQFDLALQMAEVEDMLPAVIKYNNDLFEAATIERMEGHYRTLLESIVADPSACVVDLPILTPAERSQIVVEWNDTRVDYPQNIWIHQIFEQQAAKTPDTPAVIFEGQTLTYAELNQRANQLAHYLRDRGIMPDTLVGVCMERSLEMVVSLHAVLKAGGAYVPMDPDYPADRLTHMLSDSGVVVLLTQAEVADKLPEHSAQVIRVDSEWATIAQESAENPNVALTGENLAYMIYTSGSTGKPKGAMNAHKGIYNRLMWMQEAYGLTADDAVMQKTPFSFDVSVWEFFWPLMFGARLVVAQPGGHRDPAYLIRLINEQKITTLHFVPSMLAQFVNERDVESCVSLRRAICSGEALPLDLQTRFFARLKAELHNLYGPTEAAVDVTYWACDPKTTLRTVPIGRAIDNTQIYLLDPQLQAVPIGIPGELHIGGVNLARGYHNRPELTAEKFIVNPFEAGTRLYKTGDLARWLPDGNIEYLGRIDHQVKIRGFRIELGEIEATLNQHPSVRESAVIVREDIPGDKRIVAYVVPETIASPLPLQGSPEESPVREGLERGLTASVEELGEGYVNLQELRRFLRESLPEYMIPSAFVTLEALPLSPNGKLERRALPAPEPIKRELPQTTQALTPTEAIINRVWQEILSIDQISVYDNFFDLGGHSLQAVQVINRLEKETGVHGHPGMLRFATLGQLAAQYDEQNIPAEGVEIVQEAPKQEVVGGFGRKLFQVFKRAVSSDQK
jgi:amino acid adenylation domain-containing protein